VTPTLYNVISDNVELDPDKLQRLTYKLTHMYFNWSVSIAVLGTLCYEKISYCEGQTQVKGDYSSFR
jgi:aubergine-like protein